VDPLATWLLGRAIRGFEQFVFVRLFTPVTSCGSCVCPQLPDLEHLRSACLDRAVSPTGEVQVSFYLVVFLILGAGTWGLAVGLLVGLGTGWAVRSRPGREPLRVGTLAPSSPPASRSEASVSTTASSGGRGPVSPSGRWMLQQ
jgi:hypothetical protein